MADGALPPFREVPYLPQSLMVERRDDGSILLRNGLPLRPGPAHMLAPLTYWAAAAPDRIWLAERDPEKPDRPDWICLSYGEGLSRVRALADALLRSGAGPDAPLLILAPNAIDTALITYAALWCGCPAVPVTPAHALQSHDHARLKHVMQKIGPKLAYVDEASAYAPALKAIGFDGPVFAARRGGGDATSDPIVCSEVYRAGPSGPAVDLAYDRLTSDTVAKLMLTSGSTGVPKAVINTHGMIAANVKMIRSVWNVERLEAISGGPQIMVNFLPWSHCYGAHAILHSMLDWGGTLYIDNGAPTPQRLPAMLRNLADVSPTQHTTVPAAWAAIATALEESDALARRFFDRLIVMAYGGASMGQDIYERIQRVAIRTTGERISLSAGYGATETSPTVSNVHWPNDRMGLIGLPVPGCEMKLAPVGAKLEARVRGPHVTPGYLDDEEKTAAAFDEEGFYRLGDAVKFVDPAHPERGLAFDGRIAEEFKLANGTWVSCGMVRAGVLAACDGLLADVVVCGLNAADVRLIGFLDSRRCETYLGRAFAPDPLDAALEAALAERLADYNAANPAVSTRIARLVIDPVAPDLSRGEMTEKGYLNQARLRETRSAVVERLYETEPSDNAVDLKTK